MRFNPTFVLNQPSPDEVEEVSVEIRNPDRVDVSVDRHLASMSNILTVVVNGVVVLRVSGITDSMVYHQGYA